MGEGKYIYSIIRESKEKNFGTTGINNQEVSLLHCKDIAAVVSNTPVINFDRLDKKELTRHVATHQKVNEAIMKDYDVVPMAFGIIAPSLGEVMGILEKAYLQFKTGLKKIEGKAEFAVQVWWNQKKLLRELVNTVPKIQKLKQEMSLKGGILGLPINPVRGQRGLVERQREQTSNGVKLKLGKLIQQGAETYRQASIKEIQTFLDSLIYDSTLNRLIEDDMIANLSFLVDKAREPELDRKMQMLGKKYEGKLRFKYIGPMPPYSFSNINLALGNFELVNGARKLLELGEEATLDEIKKTYYALVHQYHPDKHQTELEKVQNQMKKIIQAHSILENYCQSCDELAPHQILVGGEGKAENRKYSFREEDVKNSLIIK